MAQRPARGHWSTWLVPGIVITLLGLLLLMAGLDDADKYASVIGALGTLAGLALSFSTRAHRASRAAHSPEHGHVKGNLSQIHETGRDVTIINFLGEARPCSWTRLTMVPAWTAVGAAVLAVGLTVRGPDDQSGKKARIGHPAITSGPPVAPRIPTADASCDWKDDKGRCRAKASANPTSGASSECTGVGDGKCSASAG